MLGELPRGKPAALVSGLPGGRRLSAFSTIKRAIDAKMVEAEAEAAKEEGRDAVKVPAWTFHDFRRTGVTVLAGLGYAPHVCDRLLNHVSGAIQGVAAVYQRAEFLAERKAAIEAWAASGPWTMLGGRARLDLHGRRSSKLPSALRRHPV